MRILARVRASVSTRRELGLGLGHRWPGCRLVGARRLHRLLCRDGCLFGALPGPLQPARPPAASRPDRRGRRCAGRSPRSSRSTAASWRGEAVAAFRRFAQRALGLALGAPEPRRARPSAQPAAPRWPEASRSPASNAARAAASRSAAPAFSRLSAASSAASRSSISALSRTIRSSRRDIGCRAARAACRARPGGLACGSRLFLDLGTGDRQALEGGGSARLPRRAAPADAGRRRPAPWRRSSARPRVRRPPRWPRPAPCCASASCALASGPAQMQQRRLGLADLGRQVLEAGGLARLALQAFDLGSRVRRRRRRAARGSVRRPSAAARPRGGGCAGRKCRPPLRAARGAPAASPGSARRYGPGRPSRRARAGRLVGEQKLHVLGARFLAVDAVDRARLRARCGARPAIHRRR